MHGPTESRWRRRTLRTLPLLLGLLLSACGKPVSLVEQIRERGELVVVTRAGPTTYLQHDGVTAGLEYELAKEFADTLGVKVRFVVVDDIDEGLGLLMRGKAHLAAAGLATSGSRKERLVFGPSYQQVTQQLIFRRGTQRPRTIEDLGDGTVEVAAGGVQAELLRELSEQHPDLDWREAPEQTIPELLRQTAEGSIDFTIAPSNLFSLHQRRHPELKVAFELTKPTPVAWAFSRRHDDSLVAEAVRFFDRIRGNGELARLIDRYYGHTRQFNFANARHFMADSAERLPRLRPLFQEVAKRHSLDWRLLAAIAYQESRWEPDAVSPAGARGLMMLTAAAARHSGVKDRLDPRQSIAGGGRYLIYLRNLLPKQIPEPDRTWLALAAYNVGFGHLEDARRLTRQNGGDPDDWHEVKRSLPLLSKRQWHEKTRYGYARGHEPVRYVERIRSYYDLMVWLEREGRPAAREATALPVDGSPALRLSDASELAAETVEE